MSKLNLYSTFFPGQHIDDPKWFAGRRLDIERALKSLCSPGASIVVFGERGVGKSSFVEMIKLIATGNSHLLFKFKFQEMFPPEKFKYKVISLECDAEANTTAKVLQRLITSPNGIKSIVSTRIDKVESTVRDKYLLDFFKVFSSGFETEDKITTIEYKEDSIFEIFTNLIQSISKNVLDPGEGLLIVIDEFDLVEDSSKMASLIKTLSKNNVKFLISGIAESYEQLIKGHVSIQRQLVYGRINILPMTSLEVGDLFNIVVENSKRQIRFESTFIDEVVEKSNGYPYFVQLFGQLALDNYFSVKGEQNPMVIHNQNLINGIKRLGLFEYQMEKDYLNIIKENPLKEYVLKFLAKSASKKVHDDEIYSHCFKAGVMQPNPKNVIASLLGHREPQFLERENEESKYVFFSNPLFKTYAHTREPELLRIVENKIVLPK